MGKTIINVAITMADDDFDRLDKRFTDGEMHVLYANVLDLLVKIIEDGILGDMGIISKANVTKIE